jgi:hypothetical protein
MAEAEARTPTGSDDEEVVDSKYWNAEVTGKRPRKEVARIESAASPKQKRKGISVNAAGTRLGDIKVIADRIQGTAVHKGKDDENPLKELHHVIFARAGKWNEVRKNLLDFSGVDPSVADAETEKIAERLGRKKLDVVKDIASILAVPLSGPKEECVAAVAAFLRNPLEPSVVPRKRQSVGSVEAKEKKAAKAQRKKAKSAKAVKKSSGRPAAVKTATPFELYAKSALVKAKESNPSVSSAELDKIVAAEWEAQPEAIKAAFESAAASLKDAAKAAAAKAAPAQAAKAKVKGGVAKDKAKPKAKKAAASQSDDDDNDEDDDNDSSSSSSSGSESESDDDFGSKKKTVKKVSAGKSKSAAPSKVKPAPKAKQAAKSSAPAAAPAEDALKSSKFYSAVEDIITSASDEEMESLTKRKIRELLVAKGFAEDDVAAAKDDIAALCTQFVDKRS